jgi:tRNA-specific 2-thiouridylase
VPDERFSEHLNHPVGRGHAVAGGHAGSAGGSICGDVVRIDVRVEGETVADAGFDASGCGALTAAASACVELVRRQPLLAAARVGSADVAGELGGLSAGKLHAADLAADALARALGAAAVAQARLAPHSERVLVAMSGGVDSAVAALLIRATHPEVAAVTLELWRDAENDAEGSCCSASAVRSARALAHRMGIAHLTVDLRDAFRAGVVQPWLDDHAAGLTPNPCVRCNGSVRLDAMVDLATSLGAAALATGHYARVTGDGLLRAAADPAKDQSYMLAGLAPATIARLRFPLGELTKDRVRVIAAEHGLPVAAKPDSQDLCFLAGTGRARFLERHGGIGDRPGAIVDRRGNVLGRHRGAHRFTVGQRRGLEVGGADEPLYVLRTDIDTATVTVGTRAELATRTVRLRDVTLHRGAQAVDSVKLRYRAPAVPCALEGDTLALAEPFEGVAPGQAAVLLRGDTVVGSGTIRS